MAGKTAYWEGQYLGWAFRGATVTPPALWWVAAFTASPSDTAPGTEVSAASYYRQSIANASDAWSSPAAGGEIHNVVAVTFGTPLTDWGTIRAIGLMDAETKGTGNLCYWMELAPQIHIVPGYAPLSLPVGTLIIVDD